MSLQTSRTRAFLASLVLLSSPAIVAAQAPAAQSLDTARVNVVSRSTSLTSGSRSVSVIERADIERQPGRSVADVVARGSGMDLLPRSPAQADLSIRGSSFEQLLILVDGVRVSDDQTGHFDLDLAVPLASVERIEVLRGAGSAMYGSDAVGGVVNIVTRGGVNAAPGVRTSIAARAGSFGTASASGTLAMGAPGSGLTLAAEHERSDGHRADTDYRISQGRASVARAVGSGTLRADVGLAVRDFGAADFYAPRPSHERTTAFTTALGWRSPLPAGWSLSATASGRRHGDRFTLERDRPELYQNHHAIWQGGLELVARGGVGALAVALGGEGAGSWLRSARLGDREAGRGALFIEATTDHGSTSVNAGLRADFSSRDGSVLSPSLAVTTAIGDRARLRASAGRGFRAPTWTERYYEDPTSVGDPDLRPEYFWTGELGAKVELGHGLAFDMAAWTRRAHDLIDWARPVGAAAELPWRTRNVARATFSGLEGELLLPGWREVSWSVRGAVTELRSADAEGWVGRYALRPLTRSLSAQLAMPLATGVVLAVDAGVAGHAHERRHARADARLSYAFRDARLTVDAINLGDARYLDASGRPVAGRAVHAGVEWRW